MLPLHILKIDVVVKEYKKNITSKGSLPLLLSSCAKEKFSITTAQKPNIDNIGQDPQRGRTSILRCSPST